MGDTIFSIPLPLDEGGFFRRECPFCVKQFKIHITSEELQRLAEKGIQSYLTEQRDVPEEDDEEKAIEEEFFCPYCGQQAGVKSWWTQEQHACMHVFAKNIMARIVNENLINPLSRMGGSGNGLFSISFHGQEMEEHEPWISPETNDMEVFNLPCCETKMKIQPQEGPVRCFQCGFPYESPSSD